MKTLEKISEALASVLHYVAGAAVFGMMIVTCLDVVLRTFRMTVPGAYELVAYLGGIAVAFAMAHTTMAKGHVAVSIIVRRFPKKLQNAIDSVTSAMGCVVFFLAARKIMEMGWDYQHAGQVSMTLQMPLYPVAYAIGVSLFVVSFVLFTAFLGHAGKAIKL
ncbi:TRAP-type mannitol/chloroaromatic compound transport system, small permease component [Desulfatibacillum alkenivorans DSM 16219]|jgi:TRAP-type C4-dicarboxylate transport system permease small subunit|uniref:TRAP-type mannitol/chloroaromatic compound transport system, small permease component n=1 Tax=Desulfatibacillum alkenivorans DSM 16219 TaxID=1121393 RepID=A0A1M6RQ53_9BACT|nr:TRAP transporter small permease [Desulfatibacillum alkenivorans]SHK34544.1 TRAP-type mannitol/chloroaromatic compound transport system, small permease component [Desulfatibacillum alkenivorans DSM 16219]